MTSWRDEKCMSSGSLWSSFFSFSFVPFRLPFFEPEVVPVPGRFMLAPFVTGANSSFAISFRSLPSSMGAKKSILNASFF